jgi:Holliday junction resolvase
VTTKSEIAKKLRKLKDFGFTVIAFGDKRKGRTASKDWVDCVIFNKKYLVMVEIKTTATKDTFSEGQKETGKKLSAIMTINKTVYYIILRDLKETDNLIDNLLGNKL